jgi:pyrroloquinoline quinone biosynthesis protein D
VNNLLTPDELEKQLRAIGAARYHNHHPFHKLLHAGDLTIDQVRAWALNRYCYQAMIPIKDATLMARMHDAELRRVWRQRIIDHDGEREGDGGIERWLVLTDGLGFSRPYVQSMQAALPGTRFAVEAYVHFVGEKPLLEAIASSLTEMFAPGIISERVSGMLAHYDFISEKTLAYFGKRMTQAPRDADFALAYVKEHARTAREQAAVLDALRFKCDVLWAQLDALYHNYVGPGPVAPGAWQPGQDIAASA